MFGFPQTIDYRMRMLVFHKSALLFRKDFKSIIAAYFVIGSTIVDFFGCFAGTLPARKDLDGLPELREDLWNESLHF